MPRRLQLPWQETRGWANVKPVSEFPQRAVAAAAAVVVVVRMEEGLKEERGKGKEMEWMEKMEWMGDRTEEEEEEERKERDSHSTS